MTRGYHREGAPRHKPKLLDADCGYCSLEGPDGDGRYDLVENDRCPVHGAGPDRSNVRRGRFGRMLKASKGSDRDAA